MQNKLAIRLVIGLFVIAALFLGYRWLSDWSLDPNKGAEANTAGYVAALEETSRGARVVLFNAEGDEIAPKGTSEEVYDREIAWGPQGNNLFISSDRASAQFGIYRWNPEKNIVENRSRQTFSLGVPTFGPAAFSDSLEGSLVVGGGRVHSYDPTMKATTQVLPPVGREVGRGEEGVMGAMQSYENFGDSFKAAKWGPNREVIWSIMRREGGEVFVASPMTPGADGKIPSPAVLLAGDRIEMDITPNGEALVSIQGFQFVDPTTVPEEFIENGRPVPPMVQGVFIVAYQNGQPVPQLLFDEKVIPEAARDLAISPDGQSFFAVMGDAQPGGGFTAKNLTLLPLTTQAPPAVIMEGEVSSPTWAPDGQKFALIKSVDGKRGLFVYNRDGSGEKRLGSSDANYSSPRFSPQGS